MSDDAETIADEIIEQKLTTVRDEIRKMGQTRERACAITKIEEAMHWMTAGRAHRVIAQMKVIREIANGDNTLR